MGTSNLFFSVDLAGERQFSRRMHGLLSRVSDLTRFFELVLVDWQFTQAQKFMREGAHEGARWAPLSERYAAWKARKYPGRKILERTGALRAAATDPEAEISRSSLRMTIPIDYAIYHQSAEPRKVLPRRPFASLTGKQKTRWMGFLRQHVWEED